MWAAAALALAVVLPLAPRAAAAEPAIRVLVVGDSITQGSAGDWTWRYRLWQHLREERVDVDFVGPREDLFDNVAKVQGSTAYADAAFDRDHAAVWGAAFAWSGYTAGSLGDGYEPDVVIVMMGLNDLTFGGRTPSAVVESTRDWIDAARAQNPSVDIVLGQQTPTWIAPSVGELNAGLGDLATELDEPGSRVVVAETAAGYQEARDTWDGVHPNAVGEVRIAAAMADALGLIGIGGSYPRPLPRVPLGPTTAPVVTAVPGVRSVVLDWSLPPGATGAVVHRRDVTAGSAWSRGPTVPGAGPLVVPGLVGGHRYAFSLSGVKGTAESDVRSSVVSAVVARPPLRAVRVRSARSPRRDVVRTTARRSALADGYVVLVDPARRCGRMPADRAFAVAGRALRVRPVARIRTEAPALWVRWLPVRDGVRGEIAARSTRCTEVR